LGSTDDVGGGAAATWPRYSFPIEISGSETPADDEALETANADAAFYETSRIAR
jgi:hypothetical protein